MPRQLLLDLAISVCFTGFPAREKAILIKLAALHKYIVKKSVTKKLSYLITGPNAGKSKLRKAAGQDTIIISIDDFLSLIKLKTD